MSSLPTNRAAPGATIDAPTANTIFTDVTVATSAIDDANVRSQALDTGQFETVIASGSGLITRHVDQTSKTSQSTYTNGSSQEVLRSSTQFTLRIGDVLRAYVSLKAVATRTNTGLTRPNLGTLSRTSGAAWVFWLEYDITSGALANWVEVPGTDAWGTYYANVVDNAAAAIDHIRTGQTSSVLTVPHVWEFQRSPAATSNPWVAFPCTDTLCRPLRRSRSYHHERTGTNVTVYGVRLMVRGIASLGKDPNGSGAGILFLRDTASIATNSNAYSDEEIDVDDVLMAFMVQAKE